MVLKFDGSWSPGRFDLSFTLPGDMNVNVTSQQVCENNANVITNGENAADVVEDGQVNTDGNIYIVSEAMNMSNVDDNFLRWALYEDISE